MRVYRPILFLSALVFVGIFARAANLETVCERILTEHESANIIERIRGPVTDFASLEDGFYYTDGDLHVRKAGVDVVLAARSHLSPLLGLSPIGVGRAVVFRHEYGTGPYVDFMELSSAQVERRLRLYNPVNTLDEDSTIRQMADGDLIFTAREGLARVNPAQAKQVRHVKTSPGTHAGDFIVLPDGRALLLQSAKPLHNDRTKNRIAIIDTHTMTKLGEWGANQARASDPNLLYYQAIALYENLLFVATYDALDIYKIVAEKFVPLRRYSYGFIRRLKVDATRQRLQILLSAPQGPDSVVLELSLSDFNNIR